MPLEDVTCEKAEGGDTFSRNILNFSTDEWYFASA
jgi:hypothetical protein